MAESATGHDIFISYASEDRDKAQQLASALEKQGWTVWRDRTIPAGRRYAEVIDEALAGTRCVVVMWSVISVTKDWVVEEAGDGSKRNILVPVRIEQIDPPRGFRLIQAADLSDWDGSVVAPQFLQFVGDITHILGPSPIEGKQEAPERIEDKEPAPGAPRNGADEDVQPASAKPTPSRRAPTDATGSKLQPTSKAGWFNSERLIRISAIAAFLAMMGGFFIKDLYFDRATVPNLRNLPVSEVVSLLKEADIRYRIETEFNATVESGTVLYQIPKAETTIQRDEDVVDLVVAKSVTVPDLVGAREDRAAIIADTAGLKLERSEYRADPTVADGTVLEQSPKPDIRVAPDTVLKVIINGIGSEPGPDADAQRSDPPVAAKDATPVAAPDMVIIPAASLRGGDAVVGEAEFAIGRYEVTFDEYDAFARATGRELPDDRGWGRGNRPVINVSWDDAAAYTKWISEQTRKRYRLPSEAEWEYAARARTDTAYWWGDEVKEGGKVWANCDGCGSQWDNKQTAPVGSFPANTFGLHDTSGNVWEWVQDCWDDDCARRVVRGGSWGNDPGLVRSAFRDGNTPDDRSIIVGFRLAQDL